MIFLLHFFHSINTFFNYENEEHSAIFLLLNSKKNNQIGTKKIYLSTTSTTSLLLRIEEGIANWSMRREPYLFQDLDVMSGSVCDHSFAVFVTYFSLAHMSWWKVQDICL